MRSAPERETQMEPKTVMPPNRPHIASLGTCIERLSTRLGGGVVLPKFGWL